MTKKRHRGKGIGRGRRAVRKHLVSKRKEKITRKNVTKQRRKERGDNV